MNPSLTIHQSRQSSRNNLEWTLLILTSILLGIWAVKGTIALRNNLLVACTFLSLYNIILEFTQGALSKQLTIWKLIPFVSLALLFFWVIAHFFFFSLEPINQFKELKSTWLRGLMASAIGLGTGLALRNHPNRLNILWLGIFVSFFILFCQYIPRAIAQKNLFVNDYHHYLFHLKINIVLMGTLLMAGINGAFIDCLRSVRYKWRLLKFSYLLYWLIAILMILWSFVFIADARNGIGLSIIIYVFWFICAIIFLIKSQSTGLNLRSWFVFVLAGFGLLLILYFAFLQTKVNSGWFTLWADAKISVQIDDYPHWQDPSQLGYPQNDQGYKVIASNYERIAWATAGVRAILQYPQGVGHLAYPLTKHMELQKNMPVGQKTQSISTHSGWVDLGLAFGLPILGLIFVILLVTFINAVRGACPAKMTVLGLIVLLSFLYLVGEVAIQHGIEILLFFLALIPATLLTNLKQIEAND
jgi:hypothetical protein